MGSIAEAETKSAESQTPSSKATLHAIIVFSNFLVIKDAVQPAQAIILFWDSSQSAKLMERAARAYAETGAASLIIVGVAENLEARSFFQSRKIPGDRIFFPTHSTTRMKVDLQSGIGKTRTCMEGKDIRTAAVICLPWQGRRLRALVKEALPSATILMLPPEGVLYHFLPRATAFPGVEQRDSVEGEAGESKAAPHDIVLAELLASELVDLGQRILGKEITSVTIPPEVKELETLFCPGDRSLNRSSLFFLT
ncbi:MAG: hypothetical protein RL141_472 [Candidatus Parcubacteria bacterium]